MKILHFCRIRQINSPTLKWDNFLYSNDMSENTVGHEIFAAVHAVFFKKTKIISNKAQWNAEKSVVLNLMRLGIIKMCSQKRVCSGEAGSNKVVKNTWKTGVIANPGPIIDPLHLKFRHDH